jgi:hypothetical protein
MLIILIIAIITYQWFGYQDFVWPERKIFVNFHSEVYYRPYGFNYF